MNKDYAIETICVKGGYEPKNTEPAVTPIVQSTTYKYDSADDLADVFDLKQNTYMYTRLGNPTLGVLENKIAALEGGVKSCSTSSGQSASLFAIANITKAGQNILAMNNLYGGTMTLLGNQLKNFGIDVRFVDVNASKEEMLSKCDENTRLVFGETLSNPSLDVIDFEKVSAVAKKLNVPLVIDNTFPTPYLCRPFDYGANIVVHSTTKYLDGHATSVGGMVVDGGNFDWESGNFPELTTPDKNYHGLIYTKAFGKAAFAAKCQAGLLRDIGATMSPFNAFLTNLGTETLHVRMERHCQNALAVAEYLEKHPKIEWVKYPGLKSSPYYELAKKYLPKGASGVVTFGVKGGVKAAKTLLDSFGLANIVTHVGDLRTIALHPASTTHRQLSEEQLIEAGVQPNLIRYSVGIENINDILADLTQALERI